MHLKLIVRVLSEPTPHHETHHACTEGIVYPNRVNYLCNWQGERESVNSFPVLTRPKRVVIELSVPHTTCPFIGIYSIVLVRWTARFEFSTTWAYDTLIMYRCFNSTTYVCML